MLPCAGRCEPLPASAESAFTHFEPASVQTSTQALPPAPRTAGATADHKALSRNTHIARKAKELSEAKDRELAAQQELEALAVASEAAAIETAAS